MRGAVAAVLLILILAIGGYAASRYLPRSECIGACVTSSSVSNSATSLTLSSSAGSPTSSASAVTARTVTNGDWLLDNPNIVNGTDVDEPPDYQALVNYTLGLINSDRASAGVAPVTLDTELSGQQHADSLAYYGTVGHWDVQGYKPYMRYTLLGGTGYVAENVAWNHCTDSAPSAAEVYLAQCDTQTVENGIANSEYFFMNSDEACCNNGHRDNIVDPMHNEVSIGIAYNSTTQSVYLVEDFEDNYISSESLQVSGSTVTLSGITQENLTGWVGGSSGADIVVYYDPTPSPIPASELVSIPSCEQYSELSEPASCAYQGSYSAGTQVAAVLAPCPPEHTCGVENFTFAQTWQQYYGNFEIVFSIGQLEAAYGNGVYTIYLWPVGDLTEPITSLSMFVSGLGAAGQ